MPAGTVMRSRPAPAPSHAAQGAQGELELSPEASNASTHAMCTAVKERPSETHDRDRGAERLNDDSLLGGVR